MRFGRRDRGSSSRTFCSGIASDAGVSPVRHTIASLSDEYHLSRDPVLAARLLKLRHRAFIDMPCEPARTWPPTHRDPFPGARGLLPQIHAEELTTELLGGAIQHHGCLPVRALLSPEQVALVRSDLALAFDACEAARGASTDANPSTRYQPFEAEPGYVRINRGERQWVERCGGVWAADSPPALCDVIDLFHQLDVPEVVGGYLGEPPALSVNKCTLRRVGPEAYPSWHQDGAFLGKGVRSVDVWIALTACGEGTDAPGLGIAPRRIDRLLPTGTAGAMVEHSIGEPEVIRALDGLEPVYPHFEPGDALLFDELFVHCTGMRPGLTGQREALETWLFTPSTFPPDYVPLVI